MQRCQGGGAKTTCAKIRYIGNIYQTASWEATARDLHHFQDYVEAEKKSERLPKDYLKVAFRSQK